MPSSISIPPSTALPTLTHLTSILHLLHHRNKNQHRRSPWFRHLSLFRKHLSRLTADLSTLYSPLPPKSTHVAQLAKRDRDKEIRTGVGARLALWRDVLVAKWRRAFSQVVADGQFAVLGLVCLAALGEACGVLEIMAGLEGEEVERGGEGEGVLREFVRGAAEEDLGEVVRREEGGREEVDAGEARRMQMEGKSEGLEGRMVGGIDGRIGSVGRKRNEGASEMVVKTKKKKQKKKGDAIDDIFG